MYLRPQLIYMVFSELHGPTDTLHTEGSKVICCRSHEMELYEILLTDLDFPFVDK